MKKIPVILSTILLSTLANAGDAPKDVETSGISLNVGGEVMVEAIAIEGRCQTQAAAADVFANELTYFYRTNNINTRRTSKDKTFF